MSIEQYRIQIKAWYKSWTIRLGALLLAFANLSEMLPLIGPYLTGSIKDAVISLMVVGMMYRRATDANQPITEIAATKLAQVTAVDESDKAGA
jgi:hypothetical protein